MRSRTTAASVPTHEPGFSASGASQRDIVVIGASAGGVEALITLFAGFPAELPASVFVVLHMMPGGTSVLPKILDRAGPLPTATAVDGEAIERGRGYVAPPDHHMLLVDEIVRLTSGPRENGHRPAVDPLFRSAARAHGKRVIAAVLSGSLDDGTAGLRMVSDAGGKALVQDPADALYPSMPESARHYTPAAQVVGTGELAAAICAAIEAPIEMDAALAEEYVKSKPVEEPALSDDDPRRGILTAITCPECGGSLWEHDEQGLLRFKCHVGHAYSPDSIEVSHGEALEGALWAALRSMQERADLFRRLARRVGGDSRLENRAKLVEEHSEVLRSLVRSVGSEPGVAGNTSGAGQ